MKILFLLIFVLPSSLYAIQNGQFVSEDSPFLDRVVKLSNTCSGVLVGPGQDTVLTAAHCLRYGWQGIDVYQYYGKYDHTKLPPFDFKVIDGRVYQVRNIVNVKIKSFEYSQELALLKLKESSVTRNLFQLEMYSPKNSYDELIDSNLIFAGFGPDFSKSIESSAGLKFGALPVSGLFKFSSYEYEMLVLGRENERKGIQIACYGDSGGPVFYINKDAVFLVGISQAIVGTHKDFAEATANEACQNELAEFLVVLPIDKQWVENNSLKN